MQQDSTTGTFNADQSGQLALVTASKKEMRHALPAEDLSLLRIGAPFSSFSYPGLLLLATGLGPINSALTLGRLLGQGIRLQGVVNLGLAGSFDLDRMGIGQPALVSTEICPEFGLRFKDRVDPRGLKWGQGRLGSRIVWERLELEPESQAARMGVQLPGHWPLAHSLTVLGVTADRDLALEMQHRHQVQLENMEGFALAWACLNSGVPFLQARAVSNLVGSREKRHWDMQTALQVLAGMLRSLLLGRS
ncbi:MAG: futalosine hydrolase [Desulfohalobiaceae bacterium]